MMIYMKIFDVVKQAVGLKFPTQMTSIWTISWFLRTGKELSRTHELEFWKVDDMEYGESVLCSNLLLYLCHWPSLARVTPRA